MFVVKRDGRREPVHFDKITARITKLSYGLNSDFCDPVGHMQTVDICVASTLLLPPSDSGYITFSYWGSSFLSSSCH